MFPGIEKNLITIKKSKIGVEIFFYLQIGTLKLFTFYLAIKNSILYEQLLHTL